MEKNKTDLERLYDGGIHHHMDWIDVTGRPFYGDSGVHCDSCTYFGNSVYTINNKLVCHVCKLRGK